MGNAPGKFWWSGGDPDQPDPVTGLSKRDITHIRRSWAPLWADAQNVGQELSLGLYRADSETKSLFKLFKNLDEDALLKSREFKAHVIDILSSLNMVVQHIHDPEVAIVMLHKIGDQHKKHHVPKKYFETFDKVLEEYLRKDRKHNSSTLESWGRFFTFMNPHIYKTLTAKD